MTTVAKRPEHTPRAVTLMASGYEILRPVSGGPFYGGGPGEGLRGKPITGGQMQPLWLVSREVFDELLSNC